MIKRDTGYKYGLKKPCVGGDKCKHIKCECGHCDAYHLWHWECQQLSRETLMTCPCKRFTQATDGGVVTSDRANTTASRKLAPKIKRKYRGKI